MGEYLQDRVDKTQRLNIASLIGNRFLSLSAFEDGELRPSRKRCFEFLFLHEVVFERLILVEDIRTKMGIQGTDAGLKEGSNITLGRLFALDKRCALEEVDHDKLKSAKVCFIVVDI